MSEVASLVAFITYIHQDTDEIIVSGLKKN